MKTLNKLFSVILKDDLKKNKKLFLIIHNKNKTTTL